jgi:hypothetical protein
MVPDFTSQKTVFEAVTVSSRISGSNNTCSGGLYFESLPRRPAFLTPLTQMLLKCIKPSVVNLEKRKIRLYLLGTEPTLLHRTARSVITVITSALNLIYFPLQHVSFDVKIASSVYITVLKFTSLS